MFYNKTGQSTKEILIEHAMRAFLAQGYEARVEDIAATVGCVRQTVYNIFGSKIGLFRAVSIRLLAETAPKMLAFADEPDIRRALLMLGENYLRTMLDPRAIQIYRIVAAQAVNEPDLAQAAHNLGAKVLKSRLKEYLARQRGLGVFADCDVDLAAEQFLGLLLGLAHQRAVDGLGGETPVQIKRRTKSAVDLFLRGYARACAFQPATVFKTAPADAAPISGPTIGTQL